MVLSFRQKGFCQLKLIYCFNFDFHIEGSLEFYCSFSFIIGQWHSHADLGSAVS